ncbi:hypothetical protein CDAR_26221 [Caerostris darwini]|uniref:Uncharacterized protein n=1 Tax=Caerostris darwini TaxID=1538125 RepID=A0AAV4N8P7_9ARAC|nr:hypothetical protein CDAR_26221 [Caerostris darwini]
MVSVQAGRQAASGICIQKLGPARAISFRRSTPSSTPFRAFNILFSAQTSAESSIHQACTPLFSSKGWGGLQKMRRVSSKMSNIRYIFKSDGTSNDLRFNTSPVHRAAAHLFRRDSERGVGVGRLVGVFVCHYPPHGDPSLPPFSTSLVCRNYGNLHDWIKPSAASVVMERG